MNDWVESSEQENWKLHDIVDNRDKHVSCLLKNVNILQLLSCLKVLNVMYVFQDLKNKS